ncbi:FAD-dependent oxidoreductase [Micromonospora sp. DT81.3]|uniref:FAD-dependent oxidoreductase n=1 Tax=Actinomycetes TaxID=1760 RepID=UPI003CF75B97
MSTADHDVIVVGAGPTGLLIAAELTRRGLDVAIFERRENVGGGSRAIGVHAPVLAALEPSGATDRILADAVRIPLGLARTRERVLGEVHFDRLPLRFPFVATVPQAATEAAVAAGGPEPRRGVSVEALVEEGSRVRVVGPADAPTASVVVVAAGSGGRSLAAPSRRMAVHTYRDRYLMADVPDAGAGAPADVAIVHLDAAGVLESFPLPQGGRRLVAWDRFTARGEQMRGGWLSDDPRDVGRLREAVARRSGDEAIAAGIDRVSAFGVRRAVARRMRAGRVFVIGDAAHEVSPIGGQGMNLGLLDAATLAPLLAGWLLRGAEPAERLAVWERRRITSARTAARLAGLNTSLGRSRPDLTHRAAMRLLRLALAGPFAAVPARAYAMGLDRDA